MAKFKVGDKVTDGNHVYVVKKVFSRWQDLQSEFGNNFHRVAEHFKSRGGVWYKLDNDKILGESDITGSIKNSRIANSHACNSTNAARSPLYTGKSREVIDKITQGKYIGGAVGTVYYNPNGPFKWMINSSGWVYVAQPSRLNVLGDRRFGWKVFRVEKDGMLKQTNYHDFDSIQEAQRAFDELKSINSTNPVVRKALNSRACGLTVKNALDYSNIRRILSKFNYKTSFGNLVEFVEAPDARENNLVIIGYKESAGFGGGSEVSISQALATKIGDELKKHYRVDSIALKGKRLVLTGDFSGMKAGNSSACNGGWVGGPSLPRMRTISDYPNDPKSQRGVEFQKWLSTIDGKDFPSDWRALLTKKGYVVPNAKVTSTNYVIRKALNAVACNSSIDDALAEAERNKYDSVVLFQKVIGRGTLFPDKFKLDGGYDCEDAVRAAVKTGKYNEAIFYKNGAIKKRIGLNSAG